MNAPPTRSVHSFSRRCSSRVQCDVWGSDVRPANAVRVRWSGAQRRGDRACLAIQAGRTGGLGVVLPGRA
jgi:hypothetical protein